MTLNTEVAFLIRVIVCMGVAVDNLEVSDSPLINRFLLYARSPTRVSFSWRLVDPWSNLWPEGVLGSLMCVSLGAC